MSDRWSISNKLFPISHIQFVSMTMQFKEAADHVFGTPCKLQINAMSAPKRYTTFIDDEIQEDLDRINRANLILTTKSLADVTPGLWKNAAYVDVTLRPWDQTKAPNYAFGHVEFKGELPRQATFFIQPDGETAKAMMIEQNPRKPIGDGYRSNGTRSRARPASARGLWL